MRSFKIRQRFYNAATEGGGQGGGAGGNDGGTNPNPEDENGQADEGIKKELEAIRSDLKKILREKIFFMEYNKPLEKESRLRDGFSEFEIDVMGE